jgi:hypothetical protein
MHESTETDLDETPLESLSDALGKKKIRRFTAIEFLIALVALVVSSPFLKNITHGTLIEAVLLTVVLASAVLVVGAGRIALGIALGLAVPTILGRWVILYWPDVLAPEVVLVLALALVTFVMVHLLRFVLKAPRVNAEVLCAGISNYLLIGFMWTIAYMLVARLVPNSFVFSVGPNFADSLDAFHAFYFSFVTLSTIGFGDIIPVSPAARMLSVVEATAGMFYVTVFIARLVALYSVEGRKGRK